MEDYTEINPIKKKQDICSLLRELNYEYEVYTSDSDEEEYNYLRGNDICITIPNKHGEYPLYIDLEDNGEFTLTYYMWHAHYIAEEWCYDKLRKDLTDILKNNKCAIIINSSKRWLYSCLSKTKIDKNYDYKNDIKKLDKVFQDEIKKEKGNIELYYWDTKDNVTIDI